MVPDDDATGESPGTPTGPASDQPGSPQSSLPSGSEARHPLLNPNVDWVKADRIHYSRGDYPGCVVLLVAFVALLVWLVL